MANLQKKRWVILFFLCLCTATPLSSMHGLYAIGWGTRSLGMGGVAQALPQETLVIASNPAGLAWLCNQIDLGAGWLRLTGSTQLADSSLPTANGQYRSGQSVFIPELGISHMHKACTSLGVAYYLKGTCDVAYERALPPEGTSPLRGLIRYSMLSPAWALRTRCNQSLGIAVNIATATTQFSGLESLVPTSRSPYHVTNRGKQTVWGVGFTVGWMIRFLDRLGIGLSYQTRTFLQRASRYKGFLPNKGALTPPATVAGGIGLYLTPYLIVGFDLGWIFWSNSSLFGNTPNATNPLGSKHGPGFGWRDQIVAKLGLSYAVNDRLCLRMGYNYGRNPTLSHSVDPNSLTLATTEHHLTLGLTWGFRCNALSLAYIHGFTHDLWGPISHDRGGGARRLSCSQNQLTASWGFFY